MAHTALAFTGCSLGADELAAQLESNAPESLRRLLAKLPAAAVGVDNHAADASIARGALHGAVQTIADANAGRRYSNAALAEARARSDVRREEERKAFAAAVADWRKGAGPVQVVRECL